MQIIWQPLINLLIVFYHLFGNNLGWAIIGLTGFIRFVLVPVTLPSMRAMQKLKEFGPDIEKLKAKHAGDRARFMQAQADFYKEKGVNPAAGCLPQLVQLVVLIALSYGFIAVFTGNGEITTRLNQVLYPPLRLTEEVSTTFFGRDLTKPDVYRVSGLPLPLPGFFLLFSALVQLLSSKLMLPQSKATEKVAKKTAGGLDDVMAASQKQMLYMFPLLTVVIGYTFPLGPILYWGTTSLFQTLQQLLVSGKMR